MLIFAIRIFLKQNKKTAIYTSLDSFKKRHGSSKSPTNNLIKFQESKKKKKKKIKYMLKIILKYMLKMFIHLNSPNV